MERLTPATADRPSHGTTQGRDPRRQGRPRRVGPPCRPYPLRRRRAATLYFVTASLFVFVGVCLLAVDWGHVQLVKTELQACADATARGYISYYQQNGRSYADAMGPQIYAAANNPVDGGTGVPPTFSVQWGSWNAGSKSFSPGGGSPVAVKVTASRTAANGNAVKLFWGSVLGQSGCDVTVTAIAAETGSQSSTLNISATANPYLAGMSTATNNLYGDTYDNAAPFQVTTIPVVPGTWITLTNVSGTTCVLPGYVASAGPNGLTSIPVHHGQNYNYTINTPGPENGIADAVMPESSFMGLFLDDNAPNTTPAPATVDWTQSSNLNKPQYTNLQIKQPFYIGDGLTNGGQVQKFLVPPGATRLYLGVWDGVGYYNNTGSLSATVTVYPAVTLVR